jgi:hypothetical protein
MCCMSKINASLHSGENARAQLRTIAKSYGAAKTCAKLLMREITDVTGMLFVPEERAGEKIRAWSLNGWRTQRRRTR